MSGQSAAAIYDCEDCKKRKCNRSWMFKHCPLCYGVKHKKRRKKKDRCFLCDDTGIVTDTVCPKKRESEFDMVYFHEYYSGQRTGYIRYPDLKGTLYQPVKLRRAFDILTSCFAYIENKKNTKGGK